MKHIDPSSALVRRDDTNNKLTLTKNNGVWASSVLLPPRYHTSRRVKLNLETLRKNRIVAVLPEAPAEIEAYKILKIQIQQRLREKNWKTLMVTSPHAGEGKTLTSINLAIVLAREYSQTVLLVDCDFKYNNIHKYLGYRSDRGVINYLMADVPVKDLIAWPGIQKFTVISGGKVAYNSAELLGSPRMKKLVYEMKDRYQDRLIIFDVPPLLNTADTMAFAPLVDSIVMVVEEGRTSIHDIDKALDIIPKEKFIGFVLNKQKNSNHGYYY